MLCDSGNQTFMRLSTAAIVWYCFDGQVRYGSKCRNNYQIGKIVQDTVRGIHCWCKQRAPGKSVMWELKFPGHSSLRLKESLDVLYRHEGLILSRFYRGNGQGACLFLKELHSWIHGGARFYTTFTFCLPLNNRYFLNELTANYTKTKIWDRAVSTKSV